MPARRNVRRKWFYRKRVKLPDGTRVEITGTPSRNTKLAAEQAERAHIDRVLNPLPVTIKKEVSTFEEWFNGRFWKEWVAVNNKPSEQESKRSIYKHHLAALGPLRLDEINASAVSQFRAALVAKNLSRKRVNNILCVLSKVLRYAAAMELIDQAPRVGLFRCERPEIESWDFDQYARLLSAAEAAGMIWCAAVCLAGEAGLRVGEVKALKWEDVDLIGGTLTVQRQRRHEQEGTPKGGRRRSVPMTETLRRALRALDVVRVGYVLRNDDGTPLRDGQATNAIRRICKRAGLPPNEWHTLRHSFGTHLALLGVNPFRLQAWMGHARMEETLLYVHLAQAHPRPLPGNLVDAAKSESDPDRRTLLMLSARAVHTPAAISSKPFALRKPVRRCISVASDEKFEANQNNNRALIGVSDGV